MKIAFAALALSLTVGVTAQANSFDSTKDKLTQAMSAEIRTDQDTVRDANRMPIETLEFFGLRDDMKIVELVPGGGWYTKILAPTLAQSGEYYGAIGTSRIKERLAGKPGFEKMNIVAEDAKLYKKEGARFYSLEINSLGVENVDMVLTFRNYHNFAKDGRMAMNKAAFDALKPGGIYAVVDHTARHNEPLNSENGRRVDPVKAIKEILDSGFELVDYSELHYRPTDMLNLEVGNKAVTGQTDRWTIKFRKPM